MSFEYYEGSVFECAEINHVDMIVNTVNCKGFMGAGLAHEFKLRYPSMFQAYKEKCSTGKIRIGTLDVYDNEGIKILNFPTKDDWKKTSNINWIKQGLLNFYNEHKNYGVKSIAFPKLGTNNGGLDWNEVKDLMERCFKAIDDGMHIYICLDSSNPKGIEGEMLSFLSKITEKELQQLGLRSDGIENLFGGLPYKRFFLVSKVKGLGLKSYEKLHSYCYQLAILGRAKDENKNNVQQLSMFDNL